MKKKEAILNRKGEDVLCALNKTFHELYVEDANGEKHPPVCLVCDEIMKRSERRSMTRAFFQEKKAILQTKESKRVPQEIKDDYIAQLGPQVPSKVSQDVLLSPQSIAVMGKSGKRDLLLVCHSCKNSLVNNRLPKFAISNS